MDRYESEWWGVEERTLQDQGQDDERFLVKARFRDPKAHQRSSSSKAEVRMIQAKEDEVITDEAKDQREEKKGKVDEEKSSSTSTETESTESSSSASKPEKMEVEAKTEDKVESVCMGKNEESPVEPETKRGISPSLAMPTEDLSSKGLSYQGMYMLGVCNWTQKERDDRERLNEDARRKRLKKAFITPEEIETKYRERVRGFKRPEVDEEELEGDDEESINKRNRQRRARGEQEVQWINQQPEQGRDKARTVLERFWMRQQDEKDEQHREERKDETLEKRLENVTNHEDAEDIAWVNENEKPEIVIPEESITEEEFKLVKEHMKEVLEDEGLLQDRYIESLEDYLKRECPEPDVKTIEQYAMTMIRKMRSQRK